MSHGHPVTTETGALATLRRLLVADGTAGHPYAAQLCTARAATRDLGDAIHALCAVHGQHPDLMTLAAGHTQYSRAREWLALAGMGFATDRAELARLMAAAGPLPSTPGQAEASAALNAERHALEMLARSERTGVAFGTAAALVGDWQAIRGVLARAADRFGITLALSALPDPFDLLRDAPERAAAFGAQQLLAQHRGLWGLLEARSSARGRN